VVSPIKYNTEPIVEKKKKELSPRQSFYYSSGWASNPVAQFGVLIMYG
jgi:hypothetical protein